MEDTKLQIQVKEGVTDVIVRTGEAPAVYDPIAVVISGQITAPRSFYDPRKGQTKEDGSPYFGIKETHILVDRYKGTIKLIHGESEKFGTGITGTLELSKEYKDLGINEGKSYTPAELAKKLRNLRHLFPDKETGMKLVGELMQFNAKITSNVEQKQDTRANKKNLFESAVETNIPETVNLNVPIFKGFKPVNLKIEIVLDARSQTAVDCYLESPEALQTINDERDKIFDEQLSQFKTDKLTIIEL